MLITLKGLLSLCAYIALSEAAIRNDNIVETLEALARDDGSEYLAATGRL